jgi:copper chaperone CopZ
MKPMKINILSITTVFALALSVRAADVKLTDVHICCPSCVKGVATATAKVTGLTAVASQDEGTISLSAADTATLQKGADALTAAGYFGKSSDPAIKINAATGAKDQKVKELKIEDLHLCCNSCVKSVNRVLGGISGVSTNTAAKGAKVFTVTGDFNEKEVMTALQGAGLTGKVAK